MPEEPASPDVSESTGQPDPPDQAPPKVVEMNATPPEKMLRWMIGVSESDGSGPSDRSEDGPQAGPPTPDESAKD